MKPFLGAAFVALLLTGCATAPPPKFITVPCKTQEVTRPAFPADALQPTDDIFTQVRALLGDRTVRQGYEGQLEASNAACR